MADSANFEVSTFNKIYSGMILTSFEMPNAPYSNRWHPFEMKTVFITTILLLSLQSAKAEYGPLRLYEMILGAEKIVYGEIIELDSLTYTLKVERSLTGDDSSLVIQRFQNWSCAYRWTDYQIGQRLFLFLRTFNGKLHAMSGGNEGELPIQDNAFYINGLSLDPPPPPPLEKDENRDDYSTSDFIESQKHKVYGMTYFGHKANLEDFIATVGQIRKCFEIEYDEYNTISQATINCEENELKKACESDRILRWTYEKLKKKRVPTSAK